MKTSRLTNPLKMLAACALLSAAASGFAATTWTPGAATGCGANLSSTGTTLCTPGSSVAGTSTTVTVSSSAYAVSNSSSASTFAAASLYDYGGGANHLGVVSSGETGTSPDHAMDNNVNTELISLKFSSSVALTSITTGWAGGQSGQTADSDMSLLAFTGGVAGYDIATYDIAGKTIAQLLTQGWTLVANIDGGTGAATYTTNGDGTALNATGISSSWWIVSAFNSGYGGSQKNVDGGNDYVKLLSVAGDLKAATPPGNKVPEPGSLALMGAAFCAALAARRRKASKSI